jgi:hypothetical protein
MAERRHRLARQIALKRLATTAEQDATNVEDEGLLGRQETDPDADAELVRSALRALAVQLFRRAARYPT